MSLSQTQSHCVESMRLIVLCSETTAGIVETVPEVFDISMTCEGLSLKSDDGG